MEVGGVREDGGGAGDRGDGPEKRYKKLGRKGYKVGEKFPWMHNP